MKKAIGKMNKKKNLVLWDDKIDKHLAKLIKEKRESAQISEKEKSQQTLKKVQRIIRGYYKEHYAKKKRQPRRDGEILRKVQPSKTKPGRDRKYEQTSHKYWNRNWL